MKPGRLGTVQSRMSKVAVLGEVQRKALFQREQRLQQRHQSRPVGRGSGGTQHMDIFCRNNDSKVFSGAL